MVSYLRRKGKVDCKLVTILTDFAPHDQWLIGHEFTDAFCVSNTKMEKYLMQYGVDKERFILREFLYLKNFLKSLINRKFIKNLI